MDRLRRLFETHPDPATDAGDAAHALVTAAAECTVVCTACADACLQEENVAEMRTCIRNNVDCADVCAATARLISRPGKQDASTLRAQLEACATACRACAAECERHANRMKHCAVCAESCRACAEACDRMKAAIQAA